MGGTPLSEEWERRAGDWERWARTPGHDLHFHGFNWPSFVDLLPPPGEATLDIGCGEGRGGVALRELGHRLTGVDAAPSMVRLASETGAYERVLAADAAALPFADGAFDLALAFMSLQDMDDADGAVAEAARTLVAGGRLVAAFVHPFASAHLGRDVEQQRSYFEVLRTVDDVERDGIAFTFHQVHRPLEAWLALFLDAGLAIEAVREPRPDADDPRLAKARRQPAFLHVRCVKPAGAPPPSPPPRARPRPRPPAS
jgi:SAM-dependent methyltransferase